MRHRPLILVLVAVALSTAAMVACQGVADVRDLTLARPASSTAVVIADAGVDARATMLDGATDAPADADAESGDWTISSPDPPTNLVLDGAYLYWTTLGTGPKDAKVLRMPKVGGPITVLATKMANAAKIAFDDKYLYVTSGANFDDGLVQRVDKSGDGGVVTLASQLSVPLGIATDQDTVYWTDLGDGGTALISGRIARANKLTGEAAPDVMQLLVLPRGVIVEDDYVYFTTSGVSPCDGTHGANGTVERAPKKPDAGTHLTYAANEDCASIVRVHDTRLFWITSSADHGTLNVVDKDGGARRVLAKNQRRLASMETDGKHVFWINANAPDGTLLACLIDDCENTTVVLATQQLSPYGLALDEDSVYWANVGVPPVVGGSINRTAKPR